MTRRCARVTCAGAGTDAGDGTGACRDVRLRAGDRSADRPRSHRDDPAPARHGDFLKVVGTMVGSIFMAKGKAGWSFYWSLFSMAVLIPRCLRPAVRCRGRGPGGRCLCSVFVLVSQHWPTALSACLLPSISGPDPSGLRRHVLATLLSPPYCRVRLLNLVVGAVLGILTTLGPLPHRPRSLSDYWQACVDAESIPAKIRVFLCPRGLSNMFYGTDPKEICYERYHCQRPDRHPPPQDGLGRDAQGRRHYGCRYCRRSQIAEDAGATSVMALERVPPTSAPRAGCRACRASRSCARSWRLPPSPSWPSAASATSPRRKCSGSGRRLRR